MTTVFDVPPELLLAKLAGKLEPDPKLAAPVWAKFAKTGVHREKPPHTANWWGLRVASLLRRVYVEGPIGVMHLSEFYGGTRDRGGAPNSSRRGSRSIVRHALKQLEAAGYVQSIRGKGRVVSGKGRSLLDNTAHEVHGEVVVKIPELKKY